MFKLIAVGAGAAGPALDDTTDPVSEARFRSLLLEEPLFHLARVPGLDWLRTDPRPGHFAVLCPWLVAIRVPDDPAVALRKLAERDRPKQGALSAGCGAKRQYPSEAVARGALSAMRRRLDWTGQDRAALSAYLCPRCSMYHVGMNDVRRTAATRVPYKRTRLDLQREQDEE